MSRTFENEVNEWKSHICHVYTDVNTYPGSEQQEKEVIQCSSEIGWYVIVGKGFLFCSYAITNHVKTV